MPRIMPDPRYFSMPSTVVGGAACRKHTLLRSGMTVANALDTQKAHKLKNRRRYVRKLINGGSSRLPADGKGPGRSPTVATRPPDAYLTLSARAPWPTGFAAHRSGAAEGGNCAYMLPGCSISETL